MSVRSDENRTVRVVPQSTFQFRVPGEYMMLETAESSLLDIEHCGIPGIKLAYL